MTEWQPMETAPRDGTRIILYAPYKKTVGEGHWYNLMQRFCFDGKVFDKCEIMATHWMPLPNPPKEKTDD